MKLWEIIHWCAAALNVCGIIISTRQYFLYKKERKKLIELENNILRPDK